MGTPEASFRAGNGGDTTAMVVLCLPAVEGALECGAEAEACGVRLRSLASVGDRLMPSPPQTTAPLRVKTTQL